MVGDPTKAQLQQTIKQQREELRQARVERDDALARAPRHDDRKPPRLRILELPSEWESRDPDTTRTPFVLVIDRAPDGVVDVDAVSELAEDITGCRGVLAFREAIQLGEDWEQVDVERAHAGLYQQTHGLDAPTWPRNGLVIPREDEPSSDEAEYWEGVDAQDRAQAGE